jgi:hypothetical protein
MISTGRPGRRPTRTKRRRGWRLARTIGLSTVTLVTSLIMPALPAHAGGTAATPSSTPAAEPPQTPGTAVCSLTDDRLTSAAGLIATTSGFEIISSGERGPASLTVYHLDSKCKVIDTDSRNRTPRDPTELVAGASNTIFIADFGDPDLSRPSIALWKLPPDSNAATIYRMSYPAGQQDAKAMLLGPNDTPIVITTKGLVYTPSGPLKAEESAPGVLLKKVGQITLAATDTANPIGLVGTTTVTGAAISPDGTHVVVRTFSDAYEWDVPKGGDLGTVITTGKPRRTPLPNETDGEAIAFSPDGKSFYTASTQHQTSSDTVNILKYTPYVAPPPGSGNAGDDSGSPWWASLTLDQLNLIFGLFALIGVGMVTAGVIGMRKAAQQRPAPRGGGRAPARSRPVGRQGRPGDDMMSGRQPSYDDGVYRSSESSGRRGNDGGSRSGPRGRSSYDDYDDRDNYDNYGDYGDGYGGGGDYGGDGRGNPPRRPGP